VHVYFDLAVGMKERLWTHLLQNEQEQASFVFATVETAGDTIIFSAQEIYLATPQDFTIQSEFHIELSDDARARLIKHAWDTGTTPVELHSHPGDWWGAMFSPSDMYGFDEFVPHCRWRLKGRQYLACLVTPAGTDALAWIDNTGIPVGLSAIRVANDQPVIPTSQSIAKINASASEV
jgi:hypothetical protein